MFLANKYINTLNSIKVAYNNKLQYVRLPINLKLLVLLNLLVKINYVKTYTQSYNYLLVELHVYPATSGWHNAKIISKPSKKFYISHKQLFLYTKSNFNSVIFLHTTRGLITHSDALKHKIGGQVVFIFFS